MSSSSSEELFTSSNVVRDGDTRHCHITSILPLTTVAADSDNNNNKNAREPIEFRVCLEASAYLALKHLENPEIALTRTTELAYRLKDCDIQFSMEFFDSEFSSITAARHLQTAILDPTRKPFALLGSARSAVSMTIATLAAAYQLPQLSPSSTSDELDDKGRAPYFGRTVPTNAGDAHALIIYLKQLGADHFGVYYINDSFGTAFHSHLARFAATHGLKVLSFSYDSESDIPRTMANLAATNVRYFVGIFNPATSTSVLLNAHKQGLVGKGYTWFLTEASLEFTDSAFSVDPTTHMQLAEALHGAGILTLNVPASEKLGIALENLFSDQEQTSDFFKHHANPSIFDNWDPPAFGCGDSSIYPLFAYDAVLSMGVAACETPTDLFTGPEFFDQLLQTQLLGISGMVSFNNVTGTRMSEAFSYRMANLRISPHRSNANTIVFDTIPSAEVVLASGEIVPVTPFVYADNTTDVPSAYPPLTVDQNFMSAAVRTGGLALGSLVALLATYMLIWLYCNRNAEVVRASQPIFLGQILVGTLIILSALIPLSMQEPVSQNALNVACGSVPWLISIGFVTAFSALFAKLWRLNRIFGVTGEARGATGFTRRMIRPRDVAMPFVILMVINLTILTAFSIVNPLKWQRVSVNSYDEFGRVMETYGTCAVDPSANENSKIRTEILFESLLVGVNLVALLCALNQTWLARKLPPEFSEVSYIGMSFVLILEVLLVAIPIVVLVDENPPARFVSQSILLSSGCLAMMIPIFAKNREQYMYRATDPDGRRQRYFYSRAVDSAQKRLFGSVSNHPQQPGGGGGGGSSWRLSAVRDPSQQLTSTIEGTNTLDLECQNSPNFFRTTWTGERLASKRDFGQSRVRRTREFYEQENAHSIRSQHRSEKLDSLRQKYSFVSGLSGRSRNALGSSKALPGIGDTSCADNDKDDDSNEVVESKDSNPTNESPRAGNSNHPTSIIPEPPFSE